MRHRKQPFPFFDHADMQSVITREWLAEERKKGPLAAEDAEMYAKLWRQAYRPPTQGKKSNAYSR